MKCDSFSRFKSRFRDCWYFRQGRLLGFKKQTIPMDFSNTTPTWFWFLGGDYLQNIPLTLLLWGGLPDSTEFVRITVHIIGIAIVTAGHGYIYCST